MGPQLILTSKDCIHDSRLRENQYLNKGIDGSTFYGGKNPNVKRQCNQYQLLFEKQSENELFPSPKRSKVEKETSPKKVMQASGKNLQKGNACKGSLLSLLQDEDDAQARRSATEASRQPWKVKSENKCTRTERSLVGCRDFPKTIPRSQTDRRYFGRVLPKTYGSARQCLDFGGARKDPPAKAVAPSACFTDDDDDKENVDAEARTSTNHINIEGIIDSLGDVDCSPVKQTENSKSSRPHYLLDVDASSTFLDRQTFATDTVAVKEDACQQTEELLQIGFPNPAGSNKCWMNATLQALLGLEPLVSDMACTSRQLDTHAKASGTTKVLNAFLLLVKSCQRKKMAVVRSSLLTLSRSLGSLDKVFLSKCQQDAAEFLVRLVDCFRDEFEKAIAAEKQVSMEKISLEDLVAGGEEVPKATNPVTENVGFTLEERLSCTRCKESADKREDHLALFVDIPRMPEGQSPRLEDAVDCYMKADTRELTCGKCGNTERSVVTTVQKLPRCLIIQVKRYTVQNSKAEKLADALAIPLDFSMKKYVTSDTVLPSLLNHNFPVSSCSNEEDSLIQCDVPADIDSDCDDEDKDLQEAVRQSLLTQEEQGNRVDDNSNEQSRAVASSAEQSFPAEESLCCPKSLEGLDSSPEFSYRLVAAISHHGLSPNSGHYVADVYSHKQCKWYHYDDELVYETSCKDVTGHSLQCNGYIFFYMYRPLFEQLCEHDRKTEDLCK